MGVERIVIVVALSCGSCSSSIRATSNPSRHDEPGCHLDGSYADIGAVDADAPLVLLYRDGVFMHPDVPALVVWADGRVARVHDDGTWMRATITPAEAARIAADVAADLHGSTRRGAVESGMTDRPTTGIVVRDGAGWRLSQVLGIAAGARGNGFAAAFRELLAVDGAPAAAYTPDDYGIEYDRFDNANAVEPWPADLPPPPADATTGGTFTVPASNAAALTAFAAMLREHSSLAFAFNGGRWAIRVVRRFRGQGTIDRVWTCARDRDD